MKPWKQILLGMGVVLLLGCGVLLIPAVHQRLFWHVDQWRIQLQYALFPPEEAVFTPAPTVAALASATPAPTRTSTPTPHPDEPTLAPSLTPTALPASASVEGVKYVDQHGLWNYCAPANLAMALSFWGWPGDRTDIGQAVKPFEKDKNVMPYELVDYVNTHTQWTALVRPGGDLNLLKSLLAAGYPVLVEKGAYMRDTTGKVSWMGHYAVVTAYDDAKQEFTTQDSYYTADYPVSYADLEAGWRAFNDTFILVYPGERQSEIDRLLGPLASEEAAARLAAQTASDEIYVLEGAQQFFAWFNRGASLVDLQDYAGAAVAYDEAFKLYAELPAADRPWRILWYQTGAYKAYFYSSRYHDVLSLADTTIQAASEPYIEESFYWRALAKNALGDTAGAIDDLRASLEYHPDFTPSVQMLAQLGQTP